MLENCIVSDIPGKQSCEFINCSAVGILLNVSYLLAILSPASMIRERIIPTVTIRNAGEILLIPTLANSSLILQGGLGYFHTRS